MSISSLSSSATLTRLSRNDRQPIAKLPNEILEQIFLISNRARISGIPDHKATRVTSLRISWVCSRWRAVALSNRQFWARCVDLRSRSHMLNEFLRRSDPWPLNLIGGEHIRAERLSILASANVARRARSLKIHFEDARLKFLSAFFEQDLPRLETIHLSTYGDVQTDWAISKDTLARADNVKEIRCIYGVNFNLTSFLDEPTPMIRRLTILELISIPIRNRIFSSDLLQFLSEAHALEFLSLKTEILANPPYVKLQRGEIKLPYLTRVVMELSSSAAGAILPFVSFSDNLCVFELKISLQEMVHYPIILSGLKHLVQHWDQHWIHSVVIRLEAHASFSIEAIDDDTPIIDSRDTASAIYSKFSFRVLHPKLADREEGRQTAMRFTPHLAYPAIQVLEPTILTTSHHISIEKSKGIPFTLDAITSAMVNLDGNSSWNLLDGLLNNETLSNMTELSLSGDAHPFIRHILDHVLDSMRQETRQGVSEYSYLPKLRVITFGMLSVGDHLPLCRDLVAAGFFIESKGTWDLKVTLPGRYEGEPPVQVAIEKILRISK